MLIRSAARIQIIAAVLTLPLAFAFASDTEKKPLSEDECCTIWNTAAGRSDLGPEGAKPYIDDFQMIDSNRDMKISNAEFKEGCAAGRVHKFRKEE